MNTFRAIRICHVVAFLLPVMVLARGALAAVGEVRDLKGEATVTDGAGTQTLRRGMPVDVGQRIVTGPNARVALQFADGTTVYLGEKTEFRVSAYRYAPQGWGGGAAFDLLRGVFRAVTGRIGEMQAPDFTVSTPVAVLGIRGTDFWGGFYFSDALDVAVFAGKGIYVQNSAGRVEIVEAGYGTTVRSANTPPEPPKRWGQGKIDAAKRAVSLEETPVPTPKSGIGEEFY